jgi:hypothetical protein
MLGAKEIIGVSLQTGDRATPIDPASDRPTEPARYRVEDFSISGVSR